MATAMGTVETSKFDYRLLSKRETAILLGFTVRTLDRLITNRQIPYIRLPSVIPGRQGRVRFDSRDVDKWLQSSRQGDDIVSIQEAGKYPA